MAWRRARGAEKAARETRESIRRESAAEELQSLAGMAKEFLACVENNQFDSAAAKARDLLSGISRAKERWTGILSAQSSSRLAGTAKRVSQVSKGLSIRHGDVSPEQREKLIGFCHEVLVELSAQSGTILSVIEGSE